MTPMSTGILASIESPRDLKRIAAPQLPALAQEVRETIVSVVSRNGGHLATNLGAVELSIALHRVFDSPVDRIIWDVGNQCYTHKLLTGRRDRFGTVRQPDGLSGFTKRGESVHDHFTAGHAGTALSSALGLARGRDQRGEDYWVVAIVGDGALGAGLSLEALNNLEVVRSRFLVIVNDNGFSISPSCGALSHRLARSRSRILDGGLFGELGVPYLGPVDGHDLDLLVSLFEQIKERKNPALLHVLTQKGKGHAAAEHDPTKFHGVSPSAPAAPSPSPAKGVAYSAVFCDELLQAARTDPCVVAITAAMLEGTGLAPFAREFPDRLFDVGIAEQHAVAFGGGLAAAGCRPVVAIYSTFLQRGYDQVVHDVCLQDLPVTFVLDRAGLVGEDGPTHHGVFDLAFLRPLPGMVLMAPKDAPELRRMLRLALHHPGPTAIRIPRGQAPRGEETEAAAPFLIGRGELVRDGHDVALIALGSMVGAALDAATALEADGLHARVVNARFVKPLDAELLVDAARSTRCVVTLEEHAAQGGFGSAVLELLAAHGVNRPITVLGLPDRFIDHGSKSALMDACGLSVKKIVKSVQETVRRAGALSRPPGQN